MPVAGFLGPFADVPAAPAAAGTGTHKRLDMTIEPPIPSNWCWAVTSAAVSSFYSRVRGIGAAKTACEVATDCMGKPCCPDPTDPSDDRNRPWALEAALDSVGHMAGDAINAPLDFMAVVTEIDAERPICCHIDWGSSDTGHYNAIIGYDSANQDVDVRDCLYPGVQTIDYATFRNAYRGTGKWDWTYKTS